MDVISPLERFTALLPRRLKVEWHQRWTSRLDDALAALPEMPSCPNELLRLLCEARADVKKRIALVLDAGQPVALIALRRRFDLWESVCDGIVPHALAPLLPGRWDAPRALGVLLKVNEWLPEVATHREIKARYRVATDVDFDALWKRQHNAESVARARNRCDREGGFTFEVDATGAAEWVIGGWRDRWADDRFGEAQIADDVLMAASYLGARGRYHAFRLMHGNRPVAGVTMLPFDGVLYFMQSHRDEAYERFGVGTRLFELFFRWTATSPYRAVDLGAGEYKERWAPRDAEVVSFLIAPLHLRFAFDAMDRARSLAHRVRRRE
jgi:hypothetical protein